MGVLMSLQSKFVEYFSNRAIFLLIQHVPVGQMWNILQIFSLSLKQVKNESIMGDWVEVLTSREHGSSYMRRPCEGHTSVRIGIQIYLLN